jgi:hypothetical protein
MKTMDVRLLDFDNCPNRAPAYAGVAEALTTLGGPSPIVTHQRVTTAEGVEAAGFRGSPTILVGRRDPLPRPEDPIGLACRSYRIPVGVDHAPASKDCRQWPMHVDPALDGRGALAGLTSVGLGVGRGLPALVSVATGITIGPRSWLLVAAGVIAVRAGTMSSVQHHRRCDTSVEPGWGC